MLTTGCLGFVTALVASAIMATANCSRVFSYSTWFVSRAVRVELTPAKRGPGQGALGVAPGHTLYKTTMRDLLTSPTRARCNHVW